MTGRVAPERDLRACVKQAMFPRVVVDDEAELGGPKWRGRCVGCGDVLSGRIARTIFVPSGAGQGALTGRVAELDVEEAECESLRLSKSGRKSAALTSAVEATSNWRGWLPGDGRDGSRGRVARCHGVAGAIGKPSGELGGVELS